MQGRITSSLNGIDKVFWAKGKTILNQRSQVKFISQFRKLSKNRPIDSIR